MLLWGVETRQWWMSVGGKRATQPTFKALHSGLVMVKKIFYKDTLNNFVSNLLGTLVCESALFI